MSPHRYTFVSMSARDLPLVKRWLGAPHVIEWWGEPGGPVLLKSCDA